MSFEILGGRQIGDKSRLLIENKLLIEESGLFVPDFVSLSTELIDETLKKNDIASSAQEVQYDDDLEKRILNVKVPDYVNEALSYINTRFVGPVSVRSDGIGESRGHGTYKTVFVSNKILSLRNAFLEVLSSYFNKEAFDFRRQSKTPQVFGMQIMPLIGQEFKNQLGVKTFSPLFSGVGYSSSLGGAAYINFGHGFAGAVESRDKLRINSREVEKAEEFDMNKYLIVSRLGDVVDYVKKIRDIPSWIKYRHDWNGGRGKVWLHRKNNINQGRIYEADVMPNDTMIRQNVQGFDVKVLFDALKRMQEERRVPQYIEWALTTDKEGYGRKIYVMQISNLEFNIQDIYFVDSSKALLEGRCEIGMKSREISKIVGCLDVSGIERLAEFNKNNDDYVLIYSNRITSDGYEDNRHFRSRLEYSHCSNASGFIELQDGKYIGEPEDHLLSRIDMTGNFFGTISKDKKHKVYDLFGGEGFKILDGNYQINASEKEKRFQVVEK